MTAASPSLRDAFAAMQAADRAELERVIDQSIVQSVIAGCALAIVRERRLWAPEYESFPEYVEARWSFKYRRACQLIETAATARVVLDDSSLDGAPIVDSWLAQLRGLSGPAVVEVYRTALKEHHGRPTAAAVKAIRQRLHPGPAITNTAEVATVTKADIERKADQVRALLADKSIAEIEAGAEHAQSVLSAERLPLYNTLIEADAALIRFLGGSAYRSRQPCPEPDLWFLRDAADRLTTQLARVVEWVGRPNDLLASLPGSRA